MNKIIQAYASIRLEAELGRVNPFAFYFESLIMSPARSLYMRGVELGEKDNVWFGFFGIQVFTCADPVGLV